LILHGTQLNVGTLNGDTAYLISVAEAPDFSYARYEVQLLAPPFLPAPLGGQALNVLPLNADIGATLAEQMMPAMTLPASAVAISRSGSAGTASQRIQVTVPDYMTYASDIAKRISYAELRVIRYSYRTDGSLIDSVIVGNATLTDATWTSTRTGSTGTLTALSNRQPLLVPKRVTVPPAIGRQESQIGTGADCLTSSYLLPGDLAIDADSGTETKVSAMQIAASARMDKLTYQ
jgi:hypothetical protein